MYVFISYRALAVDHHQEIHIFQLQTYTYLGFKGFACITTFVVKKYLTTITCDKE